VLVPILDDMAAAMFRANTRNAIVLEKSCVRGGTIHATDTSDPSEYDRQLRGEMGYDAS
jgi:hypothetical protein